jgi:hypothetical protein
MGNLFVGSFAILYAIIGFLVAGLVFFIIRELWFAGIRKEITDLYNKQIDIENKFSKVEYLLRMLVRMEKCRMIEEGYIDGEKNKFKNWNIDKDLKPQNIHKMNEINTEVPISENIETSEGIIMDNNITENEIKKENTNIFKKIFGKIKKKDK